MRLDTGLINSLLHSGINTKKEELGMEACSIAAATMNGI
jgi:hypothetical protein